MGWGRMFLLGNWGQQMDIEDQKLEIESLKMQIEANSGLREATTLRARVAQLETENSEFRLYLAALVRYLGHKSLLSQVEFGRLVKSIDGEDGTADGGYRGRIVK